VNVTTETKAARIKDSAYGKLLAKSLPRPIQTEAEHKRMTNMLLDLDEHKHIWPVLGNKGGATEVLSGRRSISKSQAKRLAALSRPGGSVYLAVAVGD